MSRRVAAQHAVGVESENVNASFLSHLDVVFEVRPDARAPYLSTSRVHYLPEDVWYRER